MVDEPFTISELLAAALLDQARDEGIGEEPNGIRVDGQRPRWAQERPSAFLRVTVDSHALAARGQMRVRDRGRLDVDVDDASGKSARLVLISGWEPGALRVRSVCGDPIAGPQGVVMRAGQWLRIAAEDDAVVGTL